MGTSIAECDEDEDEDLKDSDDGVMWDGDASDNASMIVGALRMAAEYDGDDDRMVIESHNGNVASIPAAGTQRPVRSGSMPPAVKRRAAAAAQGRKRSVSASRVADDTESLAGDVSDPETCGKFSNANVAHH